MTGDERETEATHEMDVELEADASTGAPSPDDAVAAFLALEAELAGTDVDLGEGAVAENDGTKTGSDANADTHGADPAETLAPDTVHTPASGHEDEPADGIVVGAETRPASTVPESYPLSVTTESALALQVELRDGGTTTVYLDWPGSQGVAAASPLGRLLAALNVPPDAFADLYGKTVLIERAAGHDTVLLPPEPPRGSGDWELGVAAGLGFNAVFAGLLALAVVGLPVSGALWWLLVPFLVVNLLVLPWATYRDATYLRTHSDWDQGPPFWAALSMVPVLNVGVSALYLWSRSRARFLPSEPSLVTKLTRVARRFTRTR